VDYFPSYEMVMMSDRAEAWTDDGRHVKPTLVRDIMNLFTESYIVPT
jgi:GSCFA family